VQASVLLGLELTPIGMGIVGLFGLLIGAAGYLVAKSNRGGNQAMAGQQFANPPEIQELTEAGSEQRLHARYESQPFKLRVTIDQDGQELEGLVLNQSLGGLCICVQQSLPEGSLLSLRDADSAQPLARSRVIIKNCRPHRGGWALGCQYV
jgi:hypothetical protein